MTGRDKDFELLCDEVRDCLSEMIDEAIDPTEETALRQHLDNCSECVAYKRELQELDARMREHLDHACDEEELWRRIQDRINRGGKARSSSHYEIASVDRRNTYRRAAAAIFLVGLFFGALGLLGREDERVSILTAATQDFEQFRTTGDVLDITAEHPDAVRLWMTARVDFDLPKTMAGPDGVALIGGRLCAFLGRKLAFFAYQANSDDIALYVTWAEGLEAPAENVFSAVSQDGGLTTVTWHRGDLAYVAVSNMSISKLATFVEHFRRMDDARS